MKTKGFYEMEQLRQGIIDEIESYELEIKTAQELAKTYRKGSVERNIANAKVKEIKEDINYIHLKDKLKIINYCINVCFY